MSSFRRRVRSSALLVIWLLLVAFTALVYTGLSTILHQYVDARLLAFGEAWAEFIESTGTISESTREKIVPSRRDADTEEIQELREVARSLVVLSTNGAVTWKGAAALPRPPLATDLFAKALSGAIIYDTIHVPDRPPIRRISLPVYRNGAVRYILQADTSMRFIQQTLREVLGLLVVISLLLLGLAWMGSRWLADIALSPVEVLSSTAERISGASLDTRVSLGAPYAEFQRLAQTFNAMLERLHRVLQSQRRLTADAAHELKTPLAVIQGNLEVALKKPRTAEEYHEVLLSNFTQVERLIALTRRLLTLAQFDGERPPLQRAELAVEPLLRELIDELMVLSEDRRIALRLEAQPVPPVFADKGWIRHLLINLLDNALRYTPPGGVVTIRLAAAEGGVSIAVHDTGPGIAAGHLPHLFERFYRVEPARDRESGGVGLGLAIVKEIAEAHGGRVRVESEAGKGSTFIVTMPAAIKDI